MYKIPMAVLGMRKSQDLSSFLGADGGPEDQVSGVHFLPPINSYLVESCRLLPFLVHRWTRTKSVGSEMEWDFGEEICAVGDPGHWSIVRQPSEAGLACVK